jgi:ankyrin repeat protein
MSERDSRLRIERLRKEAKRWLKALRAGDRDARVRLERALQRPAPEPGLRTVQHALAREQGCQSWTELKEREELAASSAAGSDALIAELLQSACIFSGGPLDFPAKWRRAERIRARHPELAQANLHTAVLCGELEHAARLLRADPGAVARKAGPQQWEPLLVLCYSRLPNARAAETSLDMARLLLDAGADPNSAFVSAGDWPLRFSALTGVLGRGEMDVPDHPHADALARLLLERGADPNDSQGLYNTCLVGDEPKWLELLSQYGLDARAPINWHLDPADAAKSGSDRAGSLFGYLLVAAAKNGQRARFDWLLAHGADANARSIYTGLSAYQTALLAGEPELAERLLRHGASAEPLQGVFAFAGACMRGDATEAARVLALEPDVAQSGDVLTDAVERRNLAAVRILLELGVDPNRPDRHGRLALHMGCEHRAIAELLLAHGADPCSRCYGGTACGWALDRDPEMARFHAEHSRSILDAVASGHVELAHALLAEDPGRARERSPSGDTPLHGLPADTERAETLIALLLAHGADPAARNDAGQTPGQKLDARGLDEIADLLASSLPAQHDVDSGKH